MRDVTEQIIEGVLYAARYSPIMRGVKPATSLTKPRAAILLRIDGLCLEKISNALIYAYVFRVWSKVEHKTLLSLLLGGFVRVLECDGPPTTHVVSEAARGATHHLRLMVHPVARA
jgi:hypothetical protein